MTARTLAERRVPADSPLQRIAGDETEEERSPGRVYSYYFRETLTGAPFMFAGRRVVTSYDPETWRHPPEPYYQEEWDEAGE